MWDENWLEEQDRRYISSERPSEENLMTHEERLKRITAARMSAINFECTKANYSNTTSTKGLSKPEASLSTKVM